MQADIPVPNSRIGRTIWFYIEHPLLDEFACFPLLDIGRGIVGGASAAFWKHVTTISLSYAKQESALCSAVHDAPEQIN
eukprot:419648-Amphidinium_carterae.2